VLPEHKSRKWLEDRGAPYPENRIAHLDWIVELNGKPHGSSAGGRRECNCRPEDWSKVQTALPTWAVGENVTWRSDFAVLHGMPPGYGVYIPLVIFAKPELRFQESVNGPSERLFAGPSNKTENLEDHRQKH
jgi:hypothetical protein